MSACGAQAYEGTYVGNHPFGADTLVLRADSTYYHSFRTPEGQVYRHRGRWSGWALKKYDRLDVQNFDWHIPGVGAGSAQDTVNSSWPAQVERSVWGEQYIWLDADLGYFYAKIN